MVPIMDWEEAGKWRVGEWENRRGEGAAMEGDRQEGKYLPVFRKAGLNFS